MQKERFTMKQENEAKRIRREIMKEIATIELGLSMLELSSGWETVQDEKSREAQKQIAQKLEKASIKLQSYLKDLDKIS